MGRTKLKQERHRQLLERVKQNPFLKDDDLAKEFHVSVATIRFDRAELGIAEYRERIKTVAKDGLNNNVRKAKEQKGELLDLNILHDAISVLKTDESMVFEGTDIVKSQFIFAFAENLAVKVIGAKAALIKIGNIKYIKNVTVGEKLVAKSEVIRIKDHEYIVWVKIKLQMMEIFRAKFNLIVPDDLK